MSGEFADVLEGKMPVTSQNHRSQVAAKPVEQDSRSRQNNTIAVARLLHFVLPLTNGSVLIFFFFQAEDGIRDATVTGVQTCALQISPARTSASAWARRSRWHSPE